jgi:hypothetical protein
LFVDRPPLDLNTFDWLKLTSPYRNGDIPNYVFIKFWLEQSKIDFQQIVLEEKSIRPVKSAGKNWIHENAKPRACVITM